MKIIGKFFIIFILSFNVANSHPGPEPHDDTPKPLTKKRKLQANPNQNFNKNKLGISCKATSELKPSFIPEKKINKHANLYRKTGAAYVAKGNYTIIRGTVRDEECLPVSNALIELWQTDSSGKYDRDYKVNNEWEIADKDYDPNFAYTGSARTNNLGQFMFLTIMPKARKGSVPHLNINIEHYKFDGLKTQLFFDKVPSKKLDSNLKKLKKNQRQSLVMQGEKINNTDGTIGYSFNTNITLKGIHAYKEH